MMLGTTNIKFSDPSCFPSSYSSSKSKPIFSKYILSFPSYPSKYLCYYLCCISDEADCAMIAAYCSFRLLQSDHCN